MRYRPSQSKSMRSKIQVKIQIVIGVQFLHG
jgi:hypothetical protein